MDSLWRETTTLPQLESLKADLKTDVLIIGGGMAGVLCAYMLEQAGVDYALVEADRICGGVTGDTTAKITAQHGLIYHQMLQRFGEEKTKLYLQANQWAVEEYRRLCRHIKCEFQERENFVYSRYDGEKLEKEMGVLERLGAPARLVNRIPLPISVVGAVGMAGQGQFHPLKFVQGILPGLRIFEKTKVLELKPGEAVTTGGRVRAGKIIIATHFPMLNKHGSYFLKLHQERSYVLALKHAPQIEQMYVDENERGFSARQYGEFLLFGGGGHRTGKQGRGWQPLEIFAHRHWPKAQVAFRWATQDCMTLDGVPYIGRYSRRAGDLYVATGFNKWGMTSSMVAARVLSDLVQERYSPYESLFSPSRSILWPQLAANAAQAVLGLVTPGPRCPHMGCVLKYNRQEHSWDCPCHGSRFDRDGELINGPATDDKRM
ncbi:MAG: FAD-dependent oxidoreductase [Ruminococcaceae bacterium]|nr:FAD-dependent oxidoreductase [Oscillospiraceae bacterium]